MRPVSQADSRRDRAEGHRRPVRLTEQCPSGSSCSPTWNAALPGTETRSAAMCLESGRHESPAPAIGLSRQTRHTPGCRKPGVPRSTTAKPETECARCCSSSTARPAQARSASRSTIRSRPRSCHRIGGCRRDGRHQTTHPSDREARIDVGVNVGKQNVLALLRLYDQWTCDDMRRCANVGKHQCGSLGPYVRSDE